MADVVSEPTAQQTVGKAINVISNALGNTIGLHRLLEYPGLTANTDNMPLWGDILRLQPELDNALDASCRFTDNIVNAADNLHERLGVLFRRDRAIKQHHVFGSNACELFEPILDALKPYFSNPTAIKTQADLYNIGSALSSVAIEWFFSACMGRTPFSNARVGDGKLLTQNISRNEISGTPGLSPFEVSEQIKNLGALRYVHELPSCKCWLLAINELVSNSALRDATILMPDGKNYPLDQHLRDGITIHTLYSAFEAAKLNLTL